MKFLFCFSLDLHLKVDATPAEAERQWQEAEEQIRRYAEGPRVRQFIGDTPLHLFILQFRGYDMERMGEVKMKDEK